MKGENNLKNNDFKEVIENANKSYRFMLPYGDASDVIPVGIYKVDNILSSKESPYKHSISNKYDRVLKLVKINSQEEDNQKDDIYSNFRIWKVITSRDGR